MLPPEFFSYCGFCPAEWFSTTSQDDADRQKSRHEHLRHNQPLPDQQLTGGDWQAQAIDAVRTVAARGQDFRIYDALAEFGLQSPPNHKAQNGRLSALIHDLGIAHPCGAMPSTRNGTKASQAAVWTCNPSRCVNAAHRGAA